MANKGTYCGNYEVAYSGKADPKTETRPATAEYKKIEITSGPCALLCFTKKKDTLPARIIPWDRVIGICQKEEPDKGAPSEPMAKTRTKAKKATKAESKSQ